MRELNRRLMDAKGHQWAVSVPSDFDADNIEDIMLAMHEGLCKLVAYRLDGEENWRAPDNTELPTLKKQVSFYKKMEVVGVSPEDFSEAVQKLIDKARESRIGRPTVTHWEGKQIKFDDRGPYIDASVQCSMCGEEIKGIKRMSQADGVYTRAQMMVPFDKNVIQAKPGSKLKICGSCAPKHLHPSEIGLPYPTVAEVEAEQKAAITPEVVVEVPKVKKEKDPLQELLELAKYTSDIDPQYFKGFAYGVLKALKMKGD